MRVYFFFLILFSLTLICCKNQELHYIPDQLNSIKKEDSINFDKKQWFAKDIEKDSIPGISLDRAYKEILKDKTGTEIIVAVIDGQVDVAHEDLSANIWINKKEIADNNIDDDNNGYIDDVNGWNFLGNEKREENRFVNLEMTRILRSDSTKYSKVYKAVKKRYFERLNEGKEDSVYINMVSNAKREAHQTLSKYFKNGYQYSLKDLDSLKLVYPDDEELQRDILRMSNFIQFDFTDDYISNYKVQVDGKLNKLLNLEYDDRSIINDNRPNDLTHKNYGNNHIDDDVEFLDHSTIVSGVIGGIRNNEIGTKGFSDSIKIMPLCVSAYGDEHDKDIALAIRYAVDNNAKVINMSFGKEFSLYKELVFEAFKYAEEKGVLIVTSAGNSSLDLNVYNHYYPNDNEDNGDEVSGNLIMVGSTGYKADENLLSRYSNYGNIDVDIFAPGDEIYTTAPNNKYTYRNGTSMSSAIVSGVTALIYSYYPELTASQIKQIIMDSGIAYDISVKKKDGTVVPFNTLSGSGRIINVYNALIMAEKISKK